MVFATKGLDALDARVTLRLTSSEKEMLQEEADLAGIGMSELVRSRYFGRPIIASVDLNMIKQLRQITGMLMHIHRSSGGAYSAQTASMLSDAQALMIQIQRQSKKP